MGVFLRGRVCMSSANCPPRTMHRQRVQAGSPCCRPRSWPCSRAGASSSSGPGCPGSCREGGQGGQEGEGVGSVQQEGPSASASLRGRAVEGRVAWEAAGKRRGGASVRGRGWREWVRAGKGGLAVGESRPADGKAGAAWGMAAGGRGGPLRAEARALNLRLMPLASGSCPEPHARALNLRLVP